jgi:hypothetical protein
MDSRRTERDVPECRAPIGCGRRYRREQEVVMRRFIPVFALLVWLLATPVHADEKPVEAGDPIVGEWTLLTTMGGADKESRLVLSRDKEGALQGLYHDARGGKIRLSDVDFAEGVLTFTRANGARTIRFRATIDGNRLKGRHKLGLRTVPAVGARGEEALTRLRAVRAKENERGDDIEADYKKHSMRAAPKDGFPVLFDPKLTPATEATSIRDEEFVIGVFLGDEARAYPISIMGRHELANDTCGGIPITASW